MYLPQALDVAEAATITARQLGGGSYRYRTRRRTPWSSWGRWVLAGILIFLGLILLFVFLCISRRRRSRQRRQAESQAPMTHSGGGIGGFFGRNKHNKQQNDYATNSGYVNNGFGGGYNTNTQYGNAPPPPQQYGNGAAGDYYGGQQGGVSQPAGAYFK